jgi:2'-5' RNA ligase
MGVFTGYAPVIFIPVVKSPELVELHRRVWEALDPVTTGGSFYYSPEMWVPHISIAYADVTEKNMGPVMQTLGFRSYNWEFQADNFIFIYEPAGTTGSMLVNIPFSG